jgi:hypothetical protein
MFSWLKRLVAPAKPQPAVKRAAAPAGKKTAPGGARSASRRAAPPGFLPSAPAALPEVLGEGNTQADWSAWEDSMAAMDSQMQDELVPSARVYVRDTRPSHLSDLDAETDVDAFSSVRRKRGR